MAPLPLTAASAVLTLLVLACAAVLITRTALGGTESKDRARILTAVAEVIRALRGKR
ncbi:hypothetical protein [Streptomyces sp. GbtcB6]|uniref:hypothetical protein n=1 Tax=Streptomyces sp. GbtcB6 TaxID=2824751 RepID=UPI001C30A332|nr:hypothetical protein [Streptomyces sp. GbtcB6]